jgi:hypothetical protein
MGLGGGMFCRRLLEFAGKSKDRKCQKNDLTSVTNMGFTRLLKKGVLTIFDTLTLDEGRQG